MDPANSTLRKANSYLMVEGNPFSSQDPSGLDPEVDYITVQPKGGVIATHKKFATKFQIEIAGKDLKKLEWTQYIWNVTEMWDERGNRLTQAEIEATFKNSGIIYPLYGAPNARPQLDGGFSSGPPRYQWRKFTSNTLEQLLDDHNHPVPYVKFDKGRLYAYRLQQSMMIVVRCPSDDQFAWKHEWSFTFQNFGGDNPRSPVTDPKAAGIYRFEGIQGLPKSILRP